MLRSHARILLVAMLMFPLLGTVSVTMAQDDPVELVFRQFDPPLEIEGLEQAVEKFNESHPNIQVTMETVTGPEGLPQYVREVQAGGGPDVEHLAFVWTRDLARAGQLMPLDDFIAASPPGAGLDDFLALDLAQFEGGTYGVPWTADTFVMAYRPDLFEAAGVTAFPDTWEDFQAVAAQLTADTDDNGRTDQFGFCFPAGSGPTSGMWFLVNYYLWSNGKFLVEETSDGQWEVGVTPEDVAEAMTYYNTFFDEGSTPKSLIAVDAWGDPEIVGGLGRGDCAISFFPPQTFRAAQEQSEQPLMTAPIPQGSEQRISHLGGRALGINPNTEHPEEAWEFIQFLTSQEAFDTYDQYPAQRSLLDALEFPEAEQGYVEMLPLAITFERYISSPARSTSMQEAVTREFGAVYSGQRSPEEAGQALVDSLAELLERGS